MVSIIIIVIIIVVIIIIIIIIIIAIHYYYYYCYYYYYYHCTPHPSLGKGPMGSALMGSLQIMFFAEGLFGYQSVKICQICQFCVPVSPICQN